jgi:hypothetical protein
MFWKVSFQIFWTLWCHIIRDIKKIWTDINTKNIELSQIIGIEHRSQCKPWRRRKSDLFTCGFVCRPPPPGAMTTHPRFMRPCKSTSLDYRSLFDSSRLVKNKNGLCVPVLIGPHKSEPDKHGQFVPVVD